MIDNVLYEDVGGMVLDISVTNSGGSSAILYGDIKGFTEQINNVSGGSASGVLFPSEVLENVTLLPGYSRSRVVNT